MVGFAPVESSSLRPGTKKAWKAQINQASRWLCGAEIELKPPEFSHRSVKVHLLHLSRRESSLARRVQEKSCKPAENFSAGCSWTPGWVWNFSKEGHRDVLRTLVAEHMCPTVLVIEEMPEWLMPKGVAEELAHEQAQNERRFLYVGSEDRMQDSGALAFFAKKGC